ncbi:MULTISPECIES: hypothetical protein [unclassified Kitasatospora]|uniref:hypothetical protein n=1 Tax=unclassified Kitasatospora TaxID=2633591 RepID=UPI002474CA78|nr:MULTISPECIES: hypothetical protein [unclassified Kitasatospora]MDH6123843.1 hypothetical protein [Kitasatospora sp. GP82]MDH6576058.1 hypothetical protein [Kitasatospora sp. MAP5-34]
MAFYLVTRTDATDLGEYDALIVRAKGKRQALNLVTRAAADEPFAGFKKDGSNARVERLTDGRDHDNSVLLASYFGA